jgi:hypothetical protein
MALETSSKLLSHLVHENGTIADAEYMLRTRTHSAHVPEHVSKLEKFSVLLPVITVNDPTHKVALYKADTALSVVEATVVPDTAYTASANLNSLSLLKDDGASGAEVTFDTIDGTAITIAEEEEAAFTIVESTDTLVAGDILSLQYVNNGTGADNQPQMMVFGKLREAVNPVKKYAVFRAPVACTLVSVNLAPDRSVTADANSNDIELVKDDGAAGGDTVLDNIDGTAVSFTADTNVAFTINQATDTLAAGDVLYLKYTNNGTGQTTRPAFGVTVEYRMD